MNQRRTNGIAGDTGRRIGRGPFPDDAFEGEVQALYREYLAQLLDEIRWLSVGLGWIGEQLVADRSVRRTVSRLEMRLQRALAAVNEDLFYPPPPRSDIGPAGGPIKE